MGYGTTRLNGKPLQLGNCYSQQVWENELKRELKYMEEGVKRLVKVPLTSNQFSACCSFCYNCGLTGFKSSTFLRRLNKKDYEGAAEAILMWVKGNNGKKLPGLVRRRHAEKKLFLS